MKQIKYLFLIFLLISFGTDSIVLAQNEKATVVIKAGISLPSGVYSNSIANNSSISRRSGFDFGDDIGLALAGPAFSVELTSPISKIKGLGWIFSGRLIINPTNSDDLQNFYQNSLKNSTRDTAVFSFDIGSWVHIPFMTGFSYGYNLLDDINVYATIQGGIDIAQQPYRKVDAFFTKSQTTENIEDTKYDVAVSYGLSAALEFEFFESYNLSFNYLNLGNPSFTGSRTLNPKFFTGIFDTTTKIAGDKRPVNMFLISFGYKFNI
ncbi:MAG: hypothetical protein M0P71_17690 [Melioribacteraceae bacterium]|nr:hypothetical protein [Melioribacteraceae bacterium]